MLNDNLPAPLVPADVDLTDFPFIQIDVQRILASDTWIDCSSSVEDMARGFAMTNLWYQSWHQKPASSIPNKDAVLAHLAKCSPDFWGVHRDRALSGWILCSDGRYYHPVVAEKALEAWIEKVEQRKKGASAIAARWKKPFDPNPFNEKINDCRARLEKLNPNARGLHKRGKKSAFEDSTGIPQVLTKNTAGIPQVSQPNPHKSDGSSIEQRQVIENNDISPSTASIPVVYNKYTPGIPSDSDKEGTETGIESKTTCGEASSPPSASPSQAARPALSLEFQEAKPSPQSGLDLGDDPVLYRLAALGGKTFYDVTKSYFDAKQEFFPALDMDNEFRKMSSWCQDNAAQRKTVSGYPRFINSWLSRAQNALKVQGAGKQRGSQLSAGKWDGIDKKDFKGDVRPDFGF